MSGRRAKHRRRMVRMAAAGDPAAQTWVRENLRSNSDRPGDAFARELRRIREREQPRPREAVDA